MKFEKRLIKVLEALNKSSGSIYNRYFFSLEKLGRRSYIIAIDYVYKDRVSYIGFYSITNNYFFYYYNWRRKKSIRKALFIEKTLKNNKFHINKSNQSKIELEINRKKLENENWCLYNYRKK